MKKFFLSLIFLVVLLFTPKVEAAGNVSLSANKTNVNIGEEFTVSISLSGAQVASLTARVTVDTSKVEYVSGPGNSNFRNGRIIYTWTDPNGGDSPLTGGTIATFRLKARAGGNAGFSVNGDFYAPDEAAINLNFSGVTVTVLEPATPVPVTPEPTTQPPTVPEITPEPTIQVTPVVTEVPTTPIPTNQPSTPRIENTPAILPTQANQSTPAPNVPVQTTVVEPPNTNETPSFNTNLKSLRLDVAVLTPDFSPNNLQYEAVVNESVANIDVLAVPEDSSSTIGITGNNDLQLGSNLIQVTVTAQNGSKRTYNITVYKSNEADNSNSFLENLALENVFLIPEFKFDEFNYRAELDSTQDSINVLAVPQIEEATVNIQGHENIVFGNNTITVTVTSKNGTATSTYTILAYRKTEDEELAESEMLKIDDENLTEQGVKELNEQDKIDKTGSIILAIIVSCGAVGVSGMLIWKYLKERK